MGKTEKTKVIYDYGPIGFASFIGWVGALIYFEQQATDFWSVIFAFFQACVWPGYVVYFGLKALGA